MLFLAQAAREHHLDQALERFHSVADDGIDDHFVNGVLRDLPPAHFEILLTAVGIDDTSIAEIAHLHRLETTDAAKIVRSLPFVAVNDKATLDVHPFCCVRSCAAATRRASPACFGARRIPIAKAAKASGRRSSSLRSASAISRRRAWMSGPFLYGAPKFEIAQVIGQIDDATLVRHPTLWAAATVARVYQMPSTQCLHKKRERSGAMRRLMRP